MKFANARHRSRVGFILDKRKWKMFCIKKNDYANYWWKWSLFLFLDAVATIGVLTASNNGVKLVKTLTIHYFYDYFNHLTVITYRQISSIVCHLERPRGIAFIPKILKHVQRWQILWIQSILIIAFDKREQILCKPDLQW